MPKQVKTKWETTKENPDEKHLKALFEKEVESQQAARASEEKHARRRKESLDLLIAASGKSERDLQKRVEEAVKDSKEAAREAERQHARPAVDFEALHEKDVAQAKEIEMKSEGRHPNPSWYGYIWSSATGGWWSSWAGEAEEVPNVTIASSADKFDFRAQAWSEGWWDTDFSQIHAYLAFRFRSPSWGHLHVFAYPWLHGYYSLFSDRDWLNQAYARAEVDTWMDVHQNFWRGRQYRRRFTMGGDELHPTRSGRIDGQFTQVYYTNVGEGDTVTVHVGARLYCQAGWSGSHSSLNFQAGTANYIYVPYVYWYLHH